MCLPSHALLQSLPSYLDFSYLGRGVSLHGCSRKAQPLLLTLDEGYLLTTTVPVTALEAAFSTRIVGFFYWKTILQTQMLGLHLAI